MSEVQERTPSAPENTSSMIVPGEPSAEGLTGEIEPDHPEMDDPAPGEDAATTPPAAPRRRVNEWWQRLQEQRATRRRPRPPAPTGRSKWAIAGVVGLALLVLAIVAVGLSVSLGPLRDTALAVHIDPTAASLWWIGVDGLVVVAIIAAVVLRHDPWARWYALGVVGFFTAASGLLQYLHGRGLTAPDQGAGGDPALPWQVVALVAALVIGTIFCATHLFVYVLRHLFPSALYDQAQQDPDRTAEPSSTTRKKIDNDLDAEDGPPETGRSEMDEQPPLDEETEREIRKWFAACAVNLILDAGATPSRTKIAGTFGISDRQAGYVIADVNLAREQAAKIAESLKALDPADGSNQSDPARVNGSPSGGSPAPAGGGS
ncbi:hypothetical protein [Nonomuraea typhae]|uniref:hypothetical protein n=1 Tax=Nonomuraea typhae TaxID=2603600 RepID=UPI0012F80948|nr:hypothetical protein [Nonomuraea typhae]